MVTNREKATEIKVKFWANVITGILVAAGAMYVIKGLWMQISYTW